MTAMAKLIENVALRNPETGEVVVLLAGADVPSWATDLVGEHVVEAAPKRAAAPAKSG